MRPWENDSRPDDATLRILVQKGYTDEQIGKMYGVVADTVRYYRNNAHPPIEKNWPARRDHVAEGAVPPDLDARHQQHKYTRLLRARNRRSHGDRIAPDAGRRIDDMERDLAEAGMVISYDPDRGYHLRPRDPGLDAPEAIVRWGPREVARQNENA